MESIQLFPTSKTTKTKKISQKNTKKGPGLLFPTTFKKRKSVRLSTKNKLEPVIKNPNRYRRYTLRASSSPKLSHIQEGHNEKSLVTPETVSDVIVIKKVNVLNPSLIKKKQKPTSEKPSSEKPKSKSPLENIELFPSKSNQNKTVKVPTLSKIQENISSIIEETKSKLSNKNYGGRKTKKQVK